MQVPVGFQFLSRILKQLFLLIRVPVDYTPDKRLGAERVWRRNGDRLRLLIRGVVF